MKDLHGKTLKRAGFGFILGMAVGNLLAALLGGAELFSPHLLAWAGSLPGALLVQTLLSGAVGAAAFAGIGFYDIEGWSLLRTAVVHYLLIEAVYLPIAFALGWVATAAEALVTAGCMAAAYLLIFLILWLIYHAQVRKLNQLNEARKTNKHKKLGGAR